MHPYYHHWRPMGFCRGPSRFIWFIIGAGAATAWHKCHHQTNYNGYSWCRRSAIQHQYPSPNPSPTNPDGSPQAQESPFSFKDIPKRINNIPPADWDWSQEREGLKKQEEEDRLADLRRQATETMSNMSEAALQTIASTAEALKAKLTESREQRRKQEEMHKQQPEEQSRNPPRPN